LILFKTKMFAYVNVSLAYVNLPETDLLKDRDETEVAVALGWTAHLTLMISSLLMVPTRYHINHLGSR